jgi:hypothetical protein
MTTAGQILHDDLNAITLSLAGTAAATTAVLNLPRADVLGQVRSSLNELHQITVEDVLTKVWQISSTLNRAGRKSLKTGQPQPVHINGLEVPIEYQAKLQILINQQPRATIPVVITLTLKLFNFNGVVANGNLVQLSSKTFDIAVAFAAAGRTLADRTSHLNLSLEMPLPVGGVRVVGV